MSVVEHIAYTQHVTHNSQIAPLFVCLHFGQYVFMRLLFLFSFAFLLLLPFSRTFRCSDARSSGSQICAFRICLESMNFVARFVVSSLSHAPCFIALPVYLIPRVRATVRKLPIFRISRISHILATHFLPSARRLWLFCVRWTLQGDFIGRTICGCSLECMFQEY